MLKTIAGSFFKLLKNPFLALPGIILVLVQAALWTIFFYLNDTIPRFYYELFVLKTVPDAGFFETIFLVVLANVEEFFFLSVFIALWFCATLFMVHSFVNHATRGEPPLTSAFSPIKSLGKIFGLGVFYWIILLLYSALFLFFIWLLFLGGIFGIIGYAGMIFWLFFGAFLYFKLFFLPAEFFSKHQPIKMAIKNAWSFEGKKFFKQLFFVLAILIVAHAILTAGLSIAELAPIDEIAIIIIIASMGFSSSYFGIALVDYYLSHG